MATIGGSSLTPGNLEGPSAGTRPLSAETTTLKSEVEIPKEKTKGLSSNINVGGEATIPTPSAEARFEQRHVQLKAEGDLNSTDERASRVSQKSIQRRDKAAVEEEGASGVPGTKVTELDDLIGELKPQGVKTNLSRAPSSPGNLKESSTQDKVPRKLVILGSSSSPRSSIDGGAERRFKIEEVPQKDRGEGPGAPQVQPKAAPGTTTGLPKGKPDPKLNVDGVGNQPAQPQVSTKSTQQEISENIHEFTTAHFTDVKVKTSLNKTNTGEYNLVKYDLKGKQCFKIECTYTVMAKNAQGVPEQKTFERTIFTNSENREEAVALVRGYKNTVADLALRNEKIVGGQRLQEGATPDAKLSEENVRTSMSQHAFTMDMMQAAADVRVKTASRVKIGNSMLNIVPRETYYYVNDKGQLVTTADGKVKKSDKPDINEARANEYTIVSKDKWIKMNRMHEPLATLASLRKQDISVSKHLDNVRNEVVEQQKQFEKLQQNFFSRVTIIPKTANRGEQIEYTLADQFKPLELRENQKEIKIARNNILSSEEALKSLRGQLELTEKGLKEAKGEPAKIALDNRRSELNRQITTQEGILKHQRAQLGKLNEESVNQLGNSYSAARDELSEIVFKQGRRLKELAQIYKDLKPEATTEPDQPPRPGLENDLRLIKKEQDNIKKQMLRNRDVLNLILTELHAGETVPPAQEQRPVVDTPAGLPASTYMGYDASKAGPGPLVSDSPEVFT